VLGQPARLDTLIVSLLAQPAPVSIISSSTAEADVSDVLASWRSNLPWRDDYVFWTARALSKTGSLEPHDEVLLELGKLLSREEALWLYAQLQKSRRSESEWRAEFLWLFRQVSPADLPPLPPGEALHEYPSRRDEWFPGPPPPAVEIPF
jgi:hypothetical protein